MHILNLAVGHLVARQLRDGEEVIPVLVVFLAQRRLRLHIDSAVFGFALALRRTNRHAQSATGAIFRRDLQGVFQIREFTPLGNCRLEAFGSMIGDVAVVNLGANNGVRANHDALAALNAELLVPHRNFQRNIPLLPLCGTSGEGAVDWHGADRDQVAVAGNHQAFDVADKLRRVGRHYRPHLELRGSAGGQFHFMQVLQRGIHGRKVLADD